MDQQKTNETDISTLPPEMILKIFDFLKFRDRLAASRTCKEWHQLAFSPKFCGNMRILINDHSCLAVLRGTPNYEKYRHAFVAVSSTKEKIQYAIAYFLRSAPLESLAIDCSAKCMKTILNEHLLWMRALTKLRIHMSVSKRHIRQVVTINHPNLKSVSIANLISYKIGINCPNLTHLEINLDNRNSIHLVTQLQHQLQCLDLICNDYEQVQSVTNAELTNLKKLCLTYISYCEFVELSFDKMTNLKELQLYSKYHYVVAIGEELGVLKSLSTLTLSAIDINVEGFAKALHQMIKLIDIRLINCMYEPAAQPCQIRSDYVKHLYIEYESEQHSVFLPHFPKLKKLSFTNSDDEQIDDTFVQICDFYPELEELRFEVACESKFRSPTSFSHIRKLKFLKNLHLVGLLLDDTNWTECSSMNIKEFQLEIFTTPSASDEAQQRLAESIERALSNRSSRRVWDLD